MRGMNNFGCGLINRKVMNDMDLDMRFELSKIGEGHKGNTCEQVFRKYIAKRNNIIKAKALFDVRL